MGNLSNPSVGGIRALRGPTEAPGDEAKPGNYAGTYTDGTFFQLFVDSLGANASNLYFDSQSSTDRSRGSDNPHLDRHRGRHNSSPESERPTGQAGPLTSPPPRERHRLPAQA